MSGGVSLFPPKSSGDSDGVSSLNAETGDIVLVAGTGITITPAGQEITIAATGGGSGSPGGLNHQIQYNDNGSFGGDTAVTDGSGNISASSFAAGNLTANTAIVSNGSKHFVSSPTTAAELAFVSGVTSAIQTQIDGKQATLPAADSTHDGYLTATDWNTFDNKGSVDSVSVASANGFAGSSSGGPTPAITLSTTVTGILSGNGTTISAASTTGSGSVVQATSPTLVTPALGTPTALVGTNITGTAAGLTAGNVTTNANLTGDVTSVGNATTLPTVNSDVGSFTNANITVNAKGQITAASNGAGGIPVAPTATRLLSNGSAAGWLFYCSSFNATAGDTYTNNGNTYTVVYTAVAGTYLWTTQASAPTSGATTLTKATGSGDATITVTSSEALALYTPPSGLLYLEVEAAAGGGAGGAYNATSGNPGTDTAFAGMLLGGGFGGATTTAANVPGTPGGTVLAMPAGFSVLDSYTGGAGVSGNLTDASRGQGGMGGLNRFAGNGSPAAANGPAPIPPVSNTGAGGCGCPDDPNATSGGAGGGAGAYARVIIPTPVPFLYRIGAGGTNGGASGANSYGADGVIVIKECYQ